MTIKWKEVINKIFAFHDREEASLWGNSVKKEVLLFKGQIPLGGRRRNDHLHARLRELEKKPFLL